MVRPKSTPSSSSKPISSTKTKTKKSLILGKRPKSKDKTTTGSNGVEAEEPGVRLSKRARSTRVLYEAPESISSILKAVSKVIAAENNASKKLKKEIVEKKPKVPIKSSSAKPKVPKVSAKKGKAIPEPKKKPVKNKAVSPNNKQQNNKSKINKSKKSIASISAAKKVAVAKKVQKKVKAVAKRKITSTKLKTNEKEIPEPEGVSKSNKKRKSKKETLNPKSQVTLYDKDPTFFSTLQIPHVSTIAHSRLVIRAVLMNDMKLLKQLVTKDVSQICSLCIPRSISLKHEDAYYYALQLENKEAIKILLTVHDDISDKFGPFPQIMLESESTGYGSAMMFGHSLRTVTVGRGGKEGNAAFLKDSDFYNAMKVPPVYNDAISKSIASGISYSTLEYVCTLAKDSEASVWSLMLSNIIDAIRHGHKDLAGKLVSVAIKRGGHGFNHLHEQALTLKTETFTEFKSVSVVKKSIDNCRITPIHCACINPNPYYLQTLLNSKMEFNILDSSNWTPMHYAAVCEGDGPLKLLLSRGIPTMVIDKEGNTPLNMAISAGCFHNVKLLLENELQNIDPEDSSSQNNSSLTKVNKLGLRPLHLAAQKGHVEITKALLNAGVDGDAFTTAQVDKLTPLMIACQYGHLLVVKLLIDHGVKVEVGDRRGRNAISHAVINGHAHVLSYLLRIGVNHETKDSSGNGLVMYASSYGWYFNLKLLLEAGCDASVGNQWKMTPLAIAFLKGHVGIVEMLVKQPGVDINTPVDDSNGMSLLLKTCATLDLSTSLVPRLKFLIDDLKADCLKQDFEGNNALHLLANHSLSSTDKLFAEKSKNLLDAVKFLIDRGCNSGALNIKKESPFSIASANGNFWLVEKFMELKFQLNLDVDESGNTILHHIANHAINSHAKKVYEKYFKDEKSKTMLKEMAKIYNKAGFTPLLQVLTTHKSLSSNSDDSLSDVCHFITFLVKHLEADVNATTKNDKVKDGLSASVLHLTVYVDYAKNILPLLLSKNPKLDPLNEDFRTPLTIAILNGVQSVDFAKSLIAVGANVNFKSKNDFSIGLLLLLCEKQPQLYGIIPDLLSKGADVMEVNSKTRNGVLHYIARNPNGDQALKAVKALIAKGAKVNALNIDGRTPLHLVVNSRGKETDVSYDIEDALISGGAELSIRDNLGRSVLFYCFVKIAKPLETSFLDPIELVMILVDAMKETGVDASIKISDRFKFTVLHYAAMRGSTICCSYFTSEMKSIIDLTDCNGNTAFGLSVWSGHEGCSLHFMQQSADFLKILNTDVNIQSPNPEEDRVSNSFTRTNFSPYKFENWTESPNKPFAPRSMFGLKKSVQTHQSNPTTITWIWEHTKLQQDELDKKKSEKMKYPILQEVVNKDWQGILYLMLGKLKFSGLAAGVSAALKTNRLKLALKLIHRVKDAKELDQQHETLLHTLAIHSKSGKQTELQLEVMKSLLNKGVNPLKLDDSRANAIIYAAINLNYSLIAEMSRDSLVIPYASKIPPDNFGRTPFSALFWNISEYEELPKEIKTWATFLLSNGASANVLSQYPFILSPFPGVSCLVKHVVNKNDSVTFPKYSPLIVAVIHKRYDIVKWLMNLKSKIIDLNFVDESGMSALHYAVRLNDLKMVKLLLNPDYNYNKDVSPWTTSNYSKLSKEKSGINLKIRCKKGWTVFDYLVCPSITYSQNNWGYVYKNVEPILRILYNSSVASITENSGDNISPLKRAINHKRHHIVKLMYLLLKTPANQQEICLEDFENYPKIKDDPGLGEVITSYSEDAKKCKDKKIDDHGELPIIKPDPLLGLDKDNSVVIIDSTQEIPFDCIMTKVDISYGMYGLYNFYKMQLVKEPRGKQLIFLFTQWGRVGDDGQHQKTPFTTEEDAIREFKKIFRSKSGNNWEDFKTFTPVPKRYRLLNKELTKAKQANELTVDFEKITTASKKHRSVLNSSVYDIIKQISLAHKVDTEDYGNRRYGRYQLLQNTENLPIISVDALNKGEVILNTIRELLEKKYKMRYPLDYTEEQRMQLLDEIVSLSEEYYALVPVYGYAKEKLQPIFDFGALRQRQEEIYKLLHLGFAKELIIAAEFNAELSNPFEYIYKCLETKLKLLGMENDEKWETQMILQYIENTSEDKVKVKGIYRVQRCNEGELKIDNRWLLWHGTKTENLLSILHNGLQVSPLGVSLSGNLFGKGIYFADMFAKSQKYAEGVYGSKSKFVLLCEVSLGKVHDITLEAACNAAESSGKFLPDDFNSLKTSDSLYEPDPGSSIVWKGRTVPLGQRVEKHYEDDESYGLNFNEYIVFNQNQVNLRYLVQFEE